MENVKCCRSKISILAATHCEFCNIPFPLGHQNEINIKLNTCLYIVSLETLLKKKTQWDKNILKGKKKSATM